MRPGRLPENHPKEREARQKLQVSHLPEKEIKKEPEKVLPQYKQRG